MQAMMQSMKPLTPLEKRVSSWAAVFAGAAAVGLWGPQFFRLAAVLWAAIGLVMAGFLSWAARRENRFLTGIAAYVLAFGPWPILLGGTPFLLLGVWLWFRGRPSPEEIEERRQARAAAIAEKRAGRGKGARRGAEDPAEEGSGRKRPGQSKRYTPPTPPRTGRRGR
jgi:hypothetical protein